MKVIHAQSGEQFDVVVKAATAHDLKRIKRERKFGFNWNDFPGCEIYKLELVKTGEIPGLIAIKDRPDPGFRYIYMAGIELDSDNRGRSKKYKNAAGILIAYTCRESFRKGYEGCVTLVPKTVLWEHYQKIYGFVPAGRGQLYTEKDNSSLLIQKYLQ